MIVFLLNLWTNVSYSRTDLMSPFIECNVEGSITIYDYNAKTWISNDIEDSAKPSLPASTFKILNTLIALEEGIIRTEDDVIKFTGNVDTVKYGNRQDIFRDLTVKEAFKYSAVWAYLGLANKIGRTKYAQYCKLVNYGNQDLSINDADFWNYGELAISPVNQIQLLIGIYEESMPFKKSSYKALKSIMIEEENTDYTLRAKTGFTSYKDNNIGWWIGYIELNDNVFFFATRLFKVKTKVNTRFLDCRKEITYKILKQLNIIKN